MGTTLGKPFSGLFFQEKEPRIVFFGLDATGKTSIVYKLKTGETLSTIPTIGFILESVKYKNSSFCLREIGAGLNYRLESTLKYHFEEASGIVFVVDSTDRERIEEAKSYLYMAMDKIEENVAENVAILVYGNKHDVTGAMSASEISNKLDLASLRRRNWQRNWHVQSSCALSGDGLHEGLDWLLKNIERM